MTQATTPMKRRKTSRSDASRRSSATRPAAADDAQRWRGHPIVEVDGAWVYADTGQPVSDDPARPCGACARANTPEGHDGCLGTLPGVRNACCGHGDPDAAYVQYDDGTELRGRAALSRLAPATCPPAPADGSRRASRPDASRAAADDASLVDEMDASAGLRRRDAVTDDERALGRQLLGEMVGDEDASVRPLGLEIEHGTPCAHATLAVCAEQRSITCTKCGAKLDPFAVVWRLTEDEAALRRLQASIDRSEARCVALLAEEGELERRVRRAREAVRYAEEALKRARENAQGSLEL